MTAKIDDPRFVWMPEDKFTAANGIVQVYRDRWWICNPVTEDILFVHVGLRHTQKASLIHASPQCNASAAVMLRVREQTYPWARARFVPLVLKPVDPRDYG